MCVQTAKDQPHEIPSANCLANASERINWRYAKSRKITGHKWERVSSSIHSLSRASQPARRNDSWTMASCTRRHCAHKFNKLRLISFSRWWWWLPAAIRTIEIALSMRFISDFIADDWLNRQTATTFSPRSLFRRWFSVWARNSYLMLNSVTIFVVSSFFLSIPLFDSNLIKFIEKFTRWLIIRFDETLVCAQLLGLFGWKVMSFHAIALWRCGRWLFVCWTGYPVGGKMPLNKRPFITLKTCTARDGLMRCRLLNFANRKASSKVWWDTHTHTHKSHHFA